MKGAANFATSAEINLAAILAGNDVLLIPQDIPNTFALFKASLKNGTLTEERIDHSVKKILRAKYLAGLNNYQPISEKNVLQDLNTVQDEVLHRQLIQNSLTVLKNDNNIFPIKNLKAKKIAYVALGDGKGSYFFNTLKKYTDIFKVTDQNLGKLIARLSHYDVVIIGFHKSDKNPWKSYEFSSKDLTLLDKISRNSKVILDVFTSPYSLLQVENFKNIEGLIVSYQNSKQAQELSAQAIFGAFEMNGKLPVSIKGSFKAGDGKVTLGLKRLGYSIPEAVNMSSDSLHKIDMFIDVILKQKMAPGGQILVARHGKVIYDKAFGYHTDLKKLRVKKTDLFDVASLTKILATLPMVMKAEEEKKLSIHSTLGSIVPWLKDSNKDTLELKEVLSHYGRLVAWVPFYLRTQDEKGKNLEKYYRKKRTKKYSIKVAKDLYLSREWRDSIKTIIKEVDQKPCLSYKYSDVGYYLLKEGLERKYKKKLNTLVDENFYKDLGMYRTSYLPLEKFSKSQIVPTEKDTYFRNQLIHGYVHDMGAAMLGGVGGHAGLFANANDIAKIMQMYLQDGFYGGKEFLKQKTIKKFNTRYYADVRNRRGLGFDKPQINPDEKPTCGCVSDQSFGHSGFTGTYTWADPKSGILYVFLSNRVYPTMQNRGLIESNIRTRIQKVIQNAILD